MLLVAIDFVCGRILRTLELKALEHSPFGMVAEYTMWKVDTDVVIIGASEVTHSYVPHIIEDSLGMSVYNCGRDGSRFYYQAAMINGILDRYAPKIIIWSICPDEFKSPSEEDKGVLSIIYPFYKEKDYLHDYVKVVSRYEPIKLLSNCYIYNSKLLTYLFFLFTSDYPYEKGGFAPLYGSIDGLHSHEVVYSEKACDNQVKQTFEKTIQRCKEKGVELYCVLSPRFETGDYTSLPNYLQLKSILSENDIPLIEEYYHSPILSQPEYFRDNAHLNETGARVFSQMFSSDILSILSSKEPKGEVMDSVSSQLSSKQ